MKSLIASKAVENASEDATRVWKRDTKYIWSLENQLSTSPTRVSKVFAVGRQNSLASGVRTRGAVCARICVVGSRVVSVSETPAVSSRCLCVTVCGSCRYRVFACSLGVFGEKLTRAVLASEKRERIDPIKQSRVSGVVAATFVYRERRWTRVVRDNEVCEGISGSDGFGRSHTGGGRGRERAPSHPGEYMDLISIWIM